MKLTIRALRKQKTNFLFCLLVPAHMTQTWALGEQSIVNKIPGFNVFVSGKALADCMHVKQDQKNIYMFTANSTQQQLWSVNPGQASSRFDQAMAFGFNRARLQVKGESTDSHANTIRLVFSLNGDRSNRSHIKEAYVQMENPNFGAFTLGNDKGIEGKGILSPSNFLVGSGGTDGTQSKAVINTTTGVGICPYMQGYTDESTKFVYYSPKLFGIQAMCSYTPHTKHYGESPMNASWAGGNQFDTGSIAYGLRYQATLGETAFNLSFVRLTAKSHPERTDVPLLERHDTSEWDIASTVQIGPWHAGVEYIHHGKSLFWKKNSDAQTPITPTVDRTQLPGKYYFANKAGQHHTWNFGLGYITQKWGATVSYLRNHSHTGIAATAGDNSSIAKGCACVVSLEYYIKSGLSTYFEFGHYKMENKDWAYVSHQRALLTRSAHNGTPSNKANVFTIGVKVQF